MIKHMTTIATAAVLVVGAAQGVSAQENTDEAVVTYEVAAINRFDISGSPATLLIDTQAKMAGVSDASTTWSITTNQSDMKVQAQLDSDMDDFVTLTVAFAAPTGAGSEGPQALSTTAVDLVTGITELEQAGLGVTYNLSATPGAGVVAEASRTVTYTIVAGV